jgi:hypothetical protein
MPAADASSSTFDMLLSHDAELHRELKLPPQGVLPAAAALACHQFTIKVRHQGQTTPVSTV